MLLLGTIYSSVIVFLFITIAVVMQASGAAPLATIILTGIAGILAPFITEGIKRLTAAGGRAALILTVVVSVSLASGAAFWSGEAKSFGDYINLAPWVFTEATILYRLYKPKSTSEPVT